MSGAFPAACRRLANGADTADAWDTCMYTERERAYRDRILNKLAELRDRLNDSSLNPDGTPAEWYQHLNRSLGIPTTTSASLRR